VNHYVALSETLDPLLPHFVKLCLQLVHLLLGILKLLFLLLLFLAYLILFLFGFEVGVLLLELCLLVRDDFAQTVGSVIYLLLVSQLAHPLVDQLLVQLDLLLLGVFLR